MKLIRKYSEAGASQCWVQVEHRRDAVLYTVECIAAGAKVSDVGNEDAETSLSDELLEELSEMHREWVVETLYQGAYMREYHLWEKDCKDYFSVMASRNGASISLKSAGFVREVERTLTLFDTPDLSSEVSAIREMGRRVNVMKHDPGLLLSHFISVESYETAYASISGFWEALSGCEVIDYS